MKGEYAHRLMIDRSLNVSKRSCLFGPPTGDESPFTPRFGDSRLQSGITRFQSQGIKTQRPQRRLLEAGPTAGTASPLATLNQ
jgi:hypothetical protein